MKLLASTLERHLPAATRPNLRAWLDRAVNVSSDLGALDRASFLRALSLALSDAADALELEADVEDLARQLGALGIAGGEG